MAHGTTRGYNLHDGGAHRLDNGAEISRGSLFRDRLATVLPATVLMALLGFIVTGSHENSVAADAITNALGDRAFVAAAVRAGYRTEMAARGVGKPYLLARCARTDMSGPAQCDPFPASDDRYEVRVTY